MLLYHKFVLYFNTYSGQRDRIISEWKSGKFNVLINTGIYTKGFDHKPIKTVILCRATTSEALYLQMIGRGSRIYPGKEYFNILDFGSNAERLGVYQQERVFTLEHRISGKEGIAPIKECGLINQKQKVDKYGNAGCGCLILASRKVCNYCGYIFETPKIEIDIDLVYIAQADNPFERFAKLERRAEERGYKQGWVINNVIAEGGSKALEEYAKYKAYSNGWIYRSQKLYEKAIQNYGKKDKLDSSNTGN
jgi:superfamily II DNA or RNA helicase